MHSNDEREQTYRKFRERTSNVITSYCDTFLAQFEDIKRLNDEKEINETDQLLMQMKLADSKDDGNEQFFIEYKLIDD
jgi:hypothetical protein